MENEVTWRIRDYDTGEISYLGSGFCDIISKIGSKLTGKTASKLASKAAEKLIEKGAEKVGEKTGEVLGEKIYDKFSSKPKNQPIQTHETKGEDKQKIIIDLQLIIHEKQIQLISIN